jgi:hypothetical protein
MLEVGRMPGELDFDKVTVLATPLAESRTHFGAWAIMSAPLILGLSLTLNDAVAQAAVSSVWDVITNREVIAVSQTPWQGSPGNVVKEWQALNVPTAVNVQCPPSAGAAEWTYFNEVLLAGDDIASGPFDLAGAQAFCSSNSACAGFTYNSPAKDPAGANVFFKSAIKIANDKTWSSYARNYSPPTANVTNWQFANGMMKQGVAGVCMDSMGQQPTDNAPNWMRMRACDSTLPSQRFTFNASSGQVMSLSTGQCLALSVHWLWDWQAIPSLVGCCSSDASQVFVLSAADGTLKNLVANLCLGSSDRSGPASQLWSKPVAGGGLAVMGTNGALYNQTITVLLSDVGLTGPQKVRDLWAKSDLPGSVTQSLALSVAPHDSAMFLFTAV